MKRTLAVLGAIVLVVGLAAYLHWDWVVAKVSLQFLEASGRVEKLHVPQVISALNIEPGHKIADIGAGTGLFSRPLARTVRRGGKVYAVDINTELLKHIEASARREGIHNLQTVLGTADDSNLPERVDLIFLCDTLHHIEDRQSYLNHLSARLNPSGRIAVIDFSDDWPIGHGGMRFSDKELDSWMITIGFERVQSFDFLPDNFFVLYQRPE